MVRAMGMRCGKDGNRRQGIMRPHSTWRSLRGYPQQIQPALAQGHFSDPYVKKAAQAEGDAHRVWPTSWRSRGARPAAEAGHGGGRLGAAPGGWSQWVRQELDQMERGSPHGARRGRVIASDILEMPSLAGVEFLHAGLQGRCRPIPLAGIAGRSTLPRLVRHGPQRAHGCGRPAARDEHGGTRHGLRRRPAPPRWHLPDQAVPGTGFDEYVRELRRRYAKVAIRKPAASASARRRCTPCTGQTRANEVKGGHERSCEELAARPGRRRRADGGVPELLAEAGRERLVVYSQFGAGGAGGPHQEGRHRQQRAHGQVRARRRFDRHDHRAVRDQVHQCDLIAHKVEIKQAPPDTGVSFWLLVLNFLPVLLIIGFGRR